MIKRFIYFLKLFIFAYRLNPFSIKIAWLKSCFDEAPNYRIIVIPESNKATGDITGYKIISCCLKNKGTDDNEA